MVSTSIPYARTVWGDDYAWNVIIQMVNELAENPEEGCDPLSTLDEVDENHIWNKVDITDVHAKLKEICPNNEFTELLDDQLWTSTIIDEIKTAIEKGWCECEEQEDTWVIGVWFTVNVSGGTSPYCGNYELVIDPWRSTHCIATVTYTSPCRLENIEAYRIDLDTAQGFYDIAYEESRLWVVDRRDELLAQREVENLTAELLPKRAELETLRGQLAACSSGCGAIEARIAELEDEISELEADIQTAKDERDAAKDKAEIHLDLADTAALANWALLRSMSSPDANFINMVSESLSDISIEWGMGNYPYSLPTHSNFVTEGRRPNGLRIYALFGFFTPSGYPYSDGDPGEIFSFYYSRSTQVLFCPSTGTTTTTDWVTDGRGGGIWGEYELREPLSATFTHFQYGGSIPVDEYEPNPDQ